MKYHRHLILSCGQALKAIFFEDHPANVCVESFLKKNKKWGSRDRRFFAETVYDCVRWWSYYWALIGDPSGPDDLRPLAVSFWKRQMKQPCMEGFGLLDLKVLERRDSKLKEPWLRHAFPRWLYERMKAELSCSVDEMMSYLNEPNFVVLRPNRTKIGAEDLKHHLNSQSIECEPLPGCPGALILPKRVNVFSTSAFQQGLFEVQDGSSQWVSHFLQVKPAMKVIDSCAGAGGKSLHIADLMENQGHILSLDIHQWKLDRLRLRAKRNSFHNIETRLIKGDETIETLHETADRLLLDVPCSGLGVIRRFPYNKWKQSELGLDEWNRLQDRILETHSTMLRPAGLMVYSTCSLLASENELRVRAFLQKKPCFRLIKQRYLYPTRAGFDGFYMALLEKRKA